MFLVFDNIFNITEALGNVEAASGILVDAVFGLEAVDVRGFLKLINHTFEVVFFI